MTKIIDFVGLWQ